MLVDESRSSVSADLTTLTNYLASSLVTQSGSLRIMRMFRRLTEAEFYGTTGSDYVKGPQVERFHGDQGNDTHIEEGHPVL